MVCSLFAGMSSFAQSYPQKENNIWLNNGYGLDFNSGVPADYPNSSYQTPNRDNASASICDAQGNLLFYSDGNIIWNRNNQIMQNGWDINNNGNMAPNTYFIEPAFGMSSYTFDGVVIMPMPGSSHKYYVFSVPCLYVQNSIGLYSNLWIGKLYCTVVDMELNNGLGAVDPAFRGHVIADSMAGNLQGITGEDCNYWLLGFGSDGNYKAFNIMADGIDTVPVVSALTPPLSPTVSELNVSPDRHKAAMACGAEVQVTDFDPATGIFSNEVSIGTQECRFLSFSPNSRLIYLSGLIGIRQYDLTSLTTPFTLLTLNNITAYEYDAPIRLGPDGKIYFSYLTPDSTNTVWGATYYAACVQQPDVFGTGCQTGLLTNQQLPLLHGNWYQLYQFPNEIPVRLYDTVSAIKNVPLCFGQPALLQPESAGTDYHWMAKTVGNSYLRKGDDNSASWSATEAGTYVVQYFTTNPCVLHRDTFFVKSVSFSLYLGSDTVSCDGEAVALDAHVPGGHYLWSDGSTEDHLLATQSGVYWVEVNKEGCTATDSITVGIVHIKQDLGNDTAICLEGQEAVTLSADVPAGGGAFWSTGSTDASIRVSDSGLYWVTVTDANCTGSDSIFVHKQYCDCPLLMPNAFTPNNDGKNDLFRPAVPVSCPISYYRLQVYNRWGQMIYVSFKPDEGWDGTIDGHPADMGTYMYYVQMTMGLHQSRVVRKGDFVLLR